MRKSRAGKCCCFAAALICTLAIGCGTEITIPVQTVAPKTESTHLLIKATETLPLKETAESTTLTRQISPTKQNPLWPDLAVGDFAEPVEPEGKVIYLTFDDGPNENTLKLLKILEEYDIKATFFVVDTPCISYVSDIAEGGHTIALHSGSHKYREIYASETAYFQDLQKIQSIVCSYTGECPTMIRFPGGSDNTVSCDYNRGIMTRLTGQVKEMGYRYFDWNVDSRDAAGAKTAGEVAQNVISQIAGKDVAVVLQHDIYGYSVDAVPRIIHWGLENGYRFEALTTKSPVCEHRVRN